MTILAIDPGPEQSGYVLFDDGRVIESDILPNRELLLCIKYHAMQHAFDSIAIEMIASYGMPVGAEVFETCVWIGRLMQYAEEWVFPSAIVRVFRKGVKNYLCGSSKAKDSNIRQALIDKLGVVGTKKNPGPLFGVKSHCWAALGVAVTALRL